MPCRGGIRTSTRRCKLLKIVDTIRLLIRVRCRAGSQPRSIRAARPAGVKWSLAQLRKELACESSALVIFEESRELVVVRTSFNLPLVLEV